MSKRPFPIVEATLDRIVGGGQTIATMDDGRKLFVWGGLPGEKVRVQLTKKKSKMAEGVVVEVLEPSSERIEPKDLGSYLSTSPWQIMRFDAEQHYKAALIEEAFELHDIVLPQSITVYTDGHEYEYRNKIEFSFWYDKERDELDLAFFRRGSHGKIAVTDTSLAHPSINQTAAAVRDLLRARRAEARKLKTLLVRCDSRGKTVFQLYVKDKDFEPIKKEEMTQLPADNVGFEVIYSNPLSPASIITERLQALGQVSLTDHILGVPFNYATEGFFQINLPVYEQALQDMQEWVDGRWYMVDGINERKPSANFEDSAFPAAVRQERKLDQIAPNGSEKLADGLSERETNDDGSGVNKHVVDLYSGVGTIGLTIGGDNVTLVEINESAVREMQNNIERLGRKGQARAVLAASEKALDHITSNATIIVDPPRAGLHEDVITKLLEAAPKRIIYLSCNPITQARDVSRLAATGTYGIRHHQGYNFFPRTPHIEHLVILDKR